MPRIAPYGSWASPLGAERAVAAGIGLSEVAFDGDAVLWQESRPTEQGRCTLMHLASDGTLRELTPAPWNVRTRVHEYGGGASLMQRGVLWFSLAADQRLYRIDPGRAPRPITPEAALRYADLCADAQRSLLWAVREDHRQRGEARNTLVALRDDGDLHGGRSVAEGHDFYAAPRLSPDGTQLAWLCWNHPDMPWDGCELWLATIGADATLHGARRVAGGRDEAVQQPLWSPDGRLHFVSDRSGWWNLYRCNGERVEPLCAMPAEFGQPMWALGLASYGFASARQLVCTVGRNARSTLAVLDTGTLQLRELATPCSSFGHVAAHDGSVLFTGASPLQPANVYRLRLRDGQIELLRRGSTLDADPAYTSVAQPIEFAGSSGRTTHAFYYPPRNRDFIGPPSDKPPLLVIGHGGPTGMALDAYRAGVQYWTSRGIAVVDVNYGGSSGFGRAYRQRLDGAWGIVDVQDCIHAARFLVRRGDADARRLMIRGSSAGGFTALCALAFHDDFACGTSLYGIGDLRALAADTHKFEARYLDRLVGPWPGASEVYLARSPIHHLERLNAPLLLLQGADDPVVPPAQSRRMHAALKAKGVAVAYLEFAGEQHGFRAAAHIVRALQAESFFYARVLGFTLADAVEPVAIDNL